MRQGTEPSGLGGSLKARHLESLSQENSSEQDQSLQSLKTTEMLNQYTDRQDVMLTKHILRTRTFLFNNKSIMGPSVGSIIHNSKIIVTVLTLKPTKGYFRRTSHPSSCCSISLYWSGLSPLLPLVSPEPIPNRLSSQHSNETEQRLPQVLARGEFIQD